MSRERRAAAAITAALLALAAGLRLGLVSGPPARGAVPRSDPRWSDPATVRKVRTEMSLDGAACSSCHDGSEALKGDPKRKGAFHEQIVLSHGRNELCFNCHHRVQPDHFADFDGSLIPIERVELLCARCHGPTYRDWNLGSHGRRSGYWLAAKGESKRFLCIACHDPHSPRFKPLESAPPPSVNPRGEKP